MPDPFNANRGTPRGREALDWSLREFGLGRSILIDRHGVILAGNKTVERAQALELHVPVRVVRTDGTELIVVQREDLDLSTDPRARALATADNRVGQLNLDLDPRQLVAQVAQGVNPGPLWTDAEWADHVGSAFTADSREDQVMAPGPTEIRRGDLFELGAHRLLCGDATAADDVARLLGTAAPVVMITDPPYGVAYDPAWRHRRYPGQRTAVGAVANDTTAAWPQAFALFPGSIVYAWHASPFTAVVATTLTTSGFALRAQIIWVKPHFALSRGDYHWQHEPCWYAVREGATSHWRGDRTQSTVWTVPNLGAVGGTRAGENAPTGHSTQKPVRLFEIPMLNHTTAGEAIYDPFVGSGTALIAAQKLGRVAYAMDLDPAYVQVAINRWEAYTGQSAKRVGLPVNRRRRS
jgi:DNA modification methylase